MLDRHAGREGNVTLVNGRSLPALEIAAGQVERWRIINACSARYVRLSIGGRPFRIIGGDGGATSAIETTTEKLLVPGERVESSGDARVGGACDCADRNEQERGPSVAPPLLRDYFFAPQPQPPPHPQVRLHSQRSPHVQRSVAPPQPQDVFSQRHSICFSFSIARLLLVSRSIARSREEDAAAEAALQRSEEALLPLRTRTSGAMRTM